MTLVLKVISWEGLISKVWCSGFLYLRKPFLNGGRNIVYMRAVVMVSFEFEDLFWANKETLFIPFLWLLIDLKIKKILNIMFDLRKREKLKIEFFIMFVFFWIRTLCAMNQHEKDRILERKYFWIFLLNFFFSLFFIGKWNFFLNNFSSKIKQDREYWNKIAHLIN